jgi:hypothetical protein
MRLSLSILLPRHRPEAAETLCGTDPAAVEALAVGTPALSQLPSDLAALSPDQAHEIGYGLGRLG